MTYFSNEQELKSCGIEFDIPANAEYEPKGCLEPTHAFGETPGVRGFWWGVAAGHIQNIPESDWPDWIEYLERNNATLQHRVDKDWAKPLYQGRCGYCWSYAVGGAMQANDSRDGLVHTPLSCASVAAQVKNGADVGGWPVDAAAEIAKNGICKLSSWGDCSCSGSSCRGPRSGCPARDLSNVERTRAEAACHKIQTYYEIPRDDMAATISCVLQGIPIAAGWVGHKSLWCNNHAMAVLRVIRTNRGGFQLVPDNSWNNYKRRVPVPVAPTGGVAVVSNFVKPYEE